MDVELASSNAGKIKELQDMLADLGVVIIPQQELSIPDIEETGLCFVENAILKARNAALLSGKPAIADDSGLEVDLLDGEPGIYSARFAGEGATDSTNNQKLLEMLGDSTLEQRSARYQCVIVYMRHAKDPTPIICQGSWEGHIAIEPRGDGGFGYDPLFEVLEYHRTFGQLGSMAKGKSAYRDLLPQVELGNDAYCFQEKPTENVRPAL